MEIRPMLLEAGEGWARDERCREVEKWRQDESAPNQWSPTRHAFFTLLSHTHTHANFVGAHLKNDSMCSKVVRTDCCSCDEPAIIPPHPLPSAHSQQAHLGGKAKCGVENLVLYLVLHSAVSFLSLTH